MSGRKELGRVVGMRRARFIGWAFMGLGPVGWDWFSTGRIGSGIVDYKIP